ncbi:MAG: ATP-binding protein [candidate division KSB1 bacterium]|nr:ATP-binding protein [candidate division KSB1 bacterium]
MITLSQQIGEKVLKENAEILLEGSAQLNLWSIAMETPAELVEKQNKRFAIIVDEVQDLIEVITWPYGLGCYRTCFETIYCLHIFTGSAVRIMSTEVFGYNSPLHGRVTEEYLEPFTPRDDFRLMEKLALENGLSFSQEAMEFLNELTGGHPFYTVSVVVRAIDLGYREITKAVVEEAFQYELLRGRIYLELLDRTDAHIKQMVDSEGAFRLLFEIVNYPEDRVLTRELPPVSENQGQVLERLARADIIRLNGALVQMTDPVYKIWLRDVYLPVFWQQKIADEKVEATVKRLANDVGRLFESKVRDVMYFFRGHTVPGRLFGSEDQEVQLPDFQSVSTRIKFTPFEGSEEVMEVDVLGKYRHKGEIYRWVVECNYAEKVTKKDLQTFLQKVKVLEKSYEVFNFIPWFCTRKALPPSLQDYARKHGMYFSSEKELEELFKILSEKD